VVEWRLVSHKPLGTWTEGAVVLLGDACHPTLPHLSQGAAMAIEDAAILTRCIETADGNFDYAFKLYRTNRIERASRVQKESHENVWMKYPTDPSWVYGYDATTVPLVPYTEDAA